MIVRISTEAQYRLQDSDVAELNKLDNAAVTACESGDEETFRAAFASLIGMVRDRGRALADDELSESDVILPPPDISMDEAKAEFSGEGLIPG